MKTLWKKWKTSYNGLRIQTKLTLSHLVIVLIPMLVVGVFFYTRLYSMIVTSTIRNEQELASQTVPLIENVIDEVRDSHTSLRESAFYTALTDTKRDLPLQDLAGNADAQDFYRLVRDFSSRDALSSVRIYLDCPQEDLAYIKGRKSSILQPLDKVRGTYWYGIFQGSPATSSLLCPSFYLGTYEITNYGDLAYITKDTIQRDGTVYSCYLVTYFSNDYITELLTNNIRSSENAAYIINSRDNLVATTSRSMSGTYTFSSEEIRENIMSSNTFISKKVLGETVYAGFYRIESTDWYMVLVMPAAPMLEHSYKLIFSFILIYLAFLGLAFLIATKLSQSMTRRLSLVIDQMEKVRIAPPVELPAADSRDEIGELIDTYNYMSQKIKGLLADQARAAENLRIAEFDSLQAQINPHFLYNTMEMISWLAQQGRIDEVTETVRRLSRFYRLTLSHKKGLTTIAEELEHVTIYVELQNMRFNNMLDFLVDIPDQLLEYGIPKLIFQPIVENSILHGILEKEIKEGSIVLTGWAEEEDIVLLISDDGVGMDPATLETLLTERPHSSDRQGSNVAVYNTHRRLQILYGEKYGLTYQSTKGSGTEVLIRIPAILPPPSQITEKSSEIPLPPPGSPFSSDPEQETRDYPLLDYAPALLSHPRLSMHDIAFSCGYRDIQLFYQDFVARYGFTPEDYRMHIL